MDPRGCHLKLLDLFKEAVVHVYVGDEDDDGDDGDGDDGALHDHYDYEY